MNTNTIIAATNFPLCDDLFKHILSYLSYDEKQKLFIFLKYGRFHSRICVVHKKNLYLNKTFQPNMCFKKYIIVPYYVTVGSTFKKIKDEYQCCVRRTKKVIKRTKCFVTIQYYDHRNTKPITKKFKIYVKNGTEYIKAERRLNNPEDFRNKYTKFATFER